jgi:NitT/TauT family transport system ATP-binding protein
MFARDGLIPWRTASRNVEFGLELRGLSRSERRERAAGLLAKVGLGGFANAYPKELSQGMRQRLAMARTLAIDPDIILLDEPFAALDAETRVTLQTEFTRLWDALGKTVLLVTHDLHEAVASPTGCS